ncbi:MAG: OsmC family protein [Pseudomonadota bacterium]
MQTEVEWQGKMHFVGKGSNDTTVALDAPPAVGGEDNGMRPKELLLQGLAGCTGMDVISILHKMRLEPTVFRVSVSAEMTEEHPKVFSAFHITYTVGGDIPEEKLEKAINLSQDRYCGVTHMYRSFATVTHEVNKV